MKTTELFSFNFVDRIEERTKMEKFLSTDIDNVLWVKGARGLGKTQFLKYVFQHHKDYIFCYKDIKMNEQSIDILSDFIIELQKNSKLDFISYVKKSYKKFYNTTYQKVKAIASDLSLKINTIVSVILDATYYATTYSDENKSTLDIITDYIQLMLKDKKVFVCIDNFSRCDIRTAQIFIQILKKFIHETNFKSCIVTTTEDLGEDLRNEIFQSLPYTEINIDPFTELDYFYQIMDPLFDLDEFLYEDFEYLYQKCHGSPKKLSTVISKLLEKDGIILSQNKAKINKTILMSILQKNRIKFEDDDFSSKSKWVIFSYLCLPEKVSAEIVKNLALYISKRCFLYIAYDEKMFNTELLELIDNKILSYSIDNTVSVYHDLDYIELMDIFKESQLKGLFCQYSYEFLLKNRNLPFSEELLCRHSREADIEGWEIRNFRYGKKLFHNNQIYNAQIIFNYLENSLHKLHPMKLLMIALSAYKTGNYRLAIKRFELLSPDILRFSTAKYYYFFYLGKSLNNIGKTEEAVTFLEKALGEVKKGSIMYVQTLNILHMYYIEIPEKFKKAKEIFELIKDTYKDIYPTVWANTMRGCQNFYDNTTSLKILDCALNILDDELEKAYINTTKGFILVKMNEIAMAREELKKAVDVIKRLRIHEFSYAANDLAICYMMNRSYEKAREILLEALLWNRTNYGNVVLYTHLMICSSYLDLEDEKNYYYNLLENYIETHKIVDPTMNRKIYMNLAITCQQSKNYVSEKAYLNKAKPYVKNSSSEWRYATLVNMLDVDSNIVVNRPSTQYLCDLDFDPWFLIYAHD